ncbi:MAG: transcriptional regulator [Treponema sp. GWB1_62_6]|nr:MAG: transcriptional regulator [Treponema sp. GWA1_62_8]OHE65248.1 MAG: transcriptional regulator [Treponema sp. GWC1_61_84]OHE70244.1 MAG: transcriptional regulator [Treponema sp. GWB1_62_6]OHE75867.1 MAG: transcriptional regulator [Treponema sp. RIFOXYC1_FULL_61_9]HCM26400.1 transcriptional regulator [Treponema sp.]
MKVVEKVETCSCETVHEEEVAKARRVLPYPFVLEELAEFFKVLTDPTRLKLLFALGSGELCVCDLSAVTGSGVSSVSHHLAALRREKLVKPRRDGRIIYYSLADIHVQQIIGYAREHLAE